jgi:hypothetical protein
MNYESTFDNIGLFDSRIAYFASDFLSLDETSVSEHS